MLGLGKLLNSFKDAGSSSDELRCMNSRAKSARNLSSVSPSISWIVPGPAAGPGMAAADMVATPTAPLLRLVLLSCHAQALTMICVLCIGPCGSRIGAGTSFSNMHLPSDHR